MGMNHETEMPNATSTGHPAASNKGTPDDLSQILVATGGKVGADQAGMG